MWTLVLKVKLSANPGITVNTKCRVNSVWSASTVLKVKSLVNQGVTVNTKCCVNSTFFRHQTHFIVIAEFLPKLILTIFQEKAKNCFYLKQRLFQYQLITQSISSGWLDESDYYHYITFSVNKLIKRN